jgi:predicted nucleic acid-binding protein
MPVFYIDTSALVKRYRTEQGTGVVEALLSDPRPEDRFFLSFLSIIELTSGVLRLARGRQLREETAREILARFRGDIRTFFRIWPLNEEVAADALSQVEEHRLRSADALHLATAQRIASLASGATVVMVSSDQELLDATHAAGLTTLDPKAPGSLEKLKQLRA